MFNIAVAQSGGPTAAINASLTGVFNGAEQEKEVDEIYGAENGIEGILGDRLLNLRSILMDDHDKQLLMTNGGCGQPPSFQPWDILSRSISQ